MLKKSLAALMSLTVLFLCACGNGGKDSGGEDTTEYVEKESGAVLRVFVNSNEVKRTENTRPYDESREDVTLILVIGQSNFTTLAGYKYEYVHNQQGKSDVPPTPPTLPKENTCFSLTVSDVGRGISESTDMNKLSDASNGANTVGGVTPPFGARWHELTGTKVVFVQAAVGSTGVHEWVPDPENYKCDCENYGKGVCYRTAVNLYQAAYNNLSRRYNLVYTGYIWNQGEHDESARPSATVHDDQSYYDAYKKMHESLMAELDLDFGGISVVRSYNSGDTAEASASYTRARYAQYKLCNDLDDLYMLSTISETCSHDMMDKGNPIHYTQTIFNDMGKEMADNLYSRLGLGETNGYDGIKLISKNGELIGHIGKDGDVLFGTNELTWANTSGRALIKLSALGRDDVVSCKLFIDGVDYSRYIDGFGKINWTFLKAETGVVALKVFVTVE